ncbi:dystroglycan 1 isoform X3 [Neodiprion virginianus]|uniref:dystroglycan 1 isoform X3 n=1 Tax=Neodiprion virginianus TaxID=2961670 RepID=UPI001EE6E9FF|nr:dystroglycan 1 isoform X3 [Neodiprion virginianus]
MKPLLLAFSPLLLILLLVFPLTLTLTLQEDDLVFDDVGEPSASASGPSIFSNEEHQEYNERKRDRSRDGKKHNVERLWGIPNTFVVVGHVFKMRILKQAFSGSVDHFEARGINGHPLPRWLDWDEPASTLVGIPSRKDLGLHNVMIKAVGRHGDFAKDVFSINVVPEKKHEITHKDGKMDLESEECVTHCDESEDQTLLTIVLDTRFENLKPASRVNAIENLAGFLGLHTSAFSMHPHVSKETSAPDASVILSGPGNVKRRREKHPTAIQWQVGCDGRLWHHQTDLVNQLRDQARDGTLAEVLEQPVLHWRVKTDSSSLLRNRRDTGSGDYNTDPDYYEQYDDYEDEEDIVDENNPINGGDVEGDDEDGDDNEPITEQPNIAVSKMLVDEFGRPHRHHHGEKSNEPKLEEEIDAEDLYPGILSKIGITAENAGETPQQVPVLGMLPISIPTNTTTSVPTLAPITGARNQSTIVMPSPTTVSTTTTQATTTVTPLSVSTTQRMTTQPRTTSQLTPEITDKIDLEQLNFPPREDRRLQKIQVTAGKLLSFLIPEDTFVDVEDGNARDLRLSLYKQHNPIKNNHWLQFNNQTQEVYGLPLENVISVWDYELVAEDSEGLRANATLDVHVQQHPQSRSVNHEFNISLRIDKRSAFPTNVDWEFKVVRGLAKLYGDEDTSKITVRQINIMGDHITFTWSNDSLPRSIECPEEEISKLFDVLVENENGLPSTALQTILAPEIKARHVALHKIGQCEEEPKPEPPAIVTEKPLLPKINQPPVPRNQVDRINATVGQLLVFTVPEDMAFDAEDGSAHNMKMSLMTSERMPIPDDHWLQFDSNNHQFYGVPMPKDVGRKEYQLIVTDSAGASLTDALIVVVNPSNTSPPQHIVEFSMTLEIPYKNFVHSAAQKRKFMEKLGELFHDKDASAISIDNITESTVVTWHNKTLVTSSCPHNVITQLREVIVKDEKMLTERVGDVMGSEFPVKQITITPTGLCLGDESTSVYSPSAGPPVEGGTSVGKSHDDVIITFIVPAIIIAAMLILAAIIACILYRRKRSGKMSVSEQDDERQSFRNKGIPVIFQDELDEKPDPGNKSPVILKEEKPPLPPPEYQKTEDGADVPMLQSENSEEPYQPPPPFATNRDNNRQNRPKPTPTYRKPPPYVPP